MLHDILGLSYTSLPFFHRIVSNHLTSLCFIVLQLYLLPDHHAPALKKLHHRYGSLSLIATECDNLITLTRPSTRHDAPLPSISDEAVAV